MRKTSRLPGFYKLPASQRIEIIKNFADLSDDEVNLIKTGSLSFDVVDKMIENVIGSIPFPLGIATNFVINGRDYLIPMAIEEPSVVAAASNAAKMARLKGGFSTSSTGSIMIGQIQVVKVKNPSKAKQAILSSKEEILKKANEQDPILYSLGGGANDLNVKVLQTIRGSMVIVELYVDTKDAMGANAVNTMAESVASLIERITGGQVLLRIISNLATKRLVRASVVIDKSEVGGESIVDGILDAYAFANADPYRAATHNKGIMNGVIAVALATCNDHRAIEAGGHAYAARTGNYTSLTMWEKNEDGDLVGFIELPMAVGIIGGATKTHPIAQIALKILGVKTASELGEVMAAVGLAQNLAALRALVAEGIQRGHMELHARNIAIAAGAKGAIINKVVEEMVHEKKIRLDRAKELLKKYSEE
ncbi:hydroxymethylglutaryl-CoA reductase, degradative [Candidatus Bathyarchaeota archaeon]|nr:hydroxymethylglutaryl-CoA reductase, degradative [Candidatus Bathyarchaeota archaeon]